MTTPSAEEGNCQRAADQTAPEFGGLEVLVNNVATRQQVQDLAELSTEQWERTFRVNVFSFWTTRAALKHLPDGGAIICLLCQRAAVKLLLRRDTRAGRRRDPARLTRLRGSIRDI